jgi:lipoprotein-releasing system permease protein
LNLSYFISSRIRKGDKGSFSATIHRVAVISIVVGVTALLLAFMVLGGFQDKIKEKVYAFSGHLQISKYTVSTSYEDSEIEISEQLSTQLDTTGYIKRWQPFAFKAALLKTDEEVQGVIFKGIDYHFDTAFFNGQIVEGVFPNVSGPAVPFIKYSTEVAISRHMSRFLKLGVGDEVLIYFVQNTPRFRKLKVVGIYETGLEEFDQKLILGDLNLLRRINDWKEAQATGIEVFIDESDDIFELQERLFNELDVDLYVENAEDKYMQIFDWLSLLNRNVLVFLVLILIVACFSMVSVLLILIMERTQMVGMMKAMGATDRLIRGVFISLGYRLVVRGMFIGNLIGLGLGSIQYYLKIIPLDATNYYMNFVPIAFNWWAVIGINFLFVFLIAASLLIPVSIISRIRPIQAIRFD